MPGPSQAQARGHGRPCSSQTHPRSHCGQSCSRCLNSIACISAARNPNHAMRRLSGYSWALEVEFDFDQQAIINTKDKCCTAPTIAREHG